MSLILLVGTTVEVLFVIISILIYWEFDMQVITHQKHFYPFFTIKHMLCVRERRTQNICDLWKVVHT